MHIDTVHIDTVEMEILESILQKADMDALLLFVSNRWYFEGNCPLHIGNIDIERVYSASGYWYPTFYFGGGPRHIKMSCWKEDLPSVLLSLVLAEDAFIVRAHPSTKCVSLLETNHTE